MRLALSNIAWDVSEDEGVLALLRRHRVDAVDMAPGKYFPRPTEATDLEIAGVRDWWSSRGVEITGMQSLLFGTQGLNLFGPEPVQAAMLDHLAAVCRIGAGLGATRLVFGSPKNRDRSGLTDEAAAGLSTRFFQRLGRIAASWGVVVCLEPNPPSYGANFMTTSLETLEVVERIDHPSIRMQLDTGALTLNGEDPGTILARCVSAIGHIHASEPGLIPLGDAQTDHGRIHAAIKGSLPGHVVSVEMVATVAEPHLVSIDRALAAAVRAYRPEVASRDPR